MSKQPDLRIVRTRRLIKDSFLELMETEGFSKITVASLTKKASISRNTFYLHYLDKYDLLEKLENEALLDIKELAANLPIEVATEMGFIDGRFVVIFRGIYEHISKNRRLFTIILGDNNNPVFMSKLGEMIKGIFISKTSQFNLKIPQNYMIAILIGVQTSIIREWIQSGMIETPEQIANIVATLFKDIPKNLFNHNSHFAATQEFFSEISQTLIK